MERVKRSYLLILDFYGAEVVDWQTGELVRSGNCQARFTNLNSRSHNYLRITRILKWLGEMALEHLKLGFLVFFANEAIFLKNIPKATQVGMRCVKQPYCSAAAGSCLAQMRDPRAPDPLLALGRLVACVRAPGPADAPEGLLVSQSLEGFWLGTLKKDSELEAAVKLVRGEMTVEEALALVRAPQERGSPLPTSLHVCFLIP